MCSNEIKNIFSKVSPLLIYNHLADGFWWLQESPLLSLQRADCSREVREAIRVSVGLVQEEADHSSVRPAQGPMEGSGQERMADSDQARRRL